ncbi:hypothetical protein [Janthinobacterium sp. BJB426]|uniref:hypothetical protein n=1 Tax=Janthinobacterium sp. BJB426 TaxID=2048010 RepID=UPI001305352F|nr:hypothetical protein [Janthinobacterium sp. BJB426]
MKIKLMAWLVIAILSGCSATGDDYIRGQTPTVINHPVLGSLTVAERELLGPDVNQNGIRDDIDLAIIKISDERKSDISSYVKNITRDMINGSRGVSSALSEKTSTAVVSPTISAVEKKIYLDLVINTAARRAVFSTW